MDRRPKMSGREVLHPDAASRRTNNNVGNAANINRMPNNACYNRSSNANLNRSPNKKSPKHSKTRFRDDRSRRCSNPRYVGKQQEKNLKKLHHESGSTNVLTNDSLLKRRECLSKKVGQRNEIAGSSLDINSDSVSDVTMGFCGNVSQAYDNCVSEAAKVNQEMGPVGDVRMEDMTEASSSDNSMRLSPPPAYGEHVVEELYKTLREYLQVEAKFQPNVVLPQRPQRGEISADTRDGAAHVMRCLKVWYDLPTDVLFHAINLLDRFLTKMKVRPCHMACISVSCMNIAITSHRPQLPAISTQDLVSISQCKCTVGDVNRMSAVIGEKLGAVGDAVTPLQWLRLFISLFLLVEPRVASQLLPEPEMANRLEILSCEAACCNVRPCELALVLLCTHLDSQVTHMQRQNQTSPQPQGQDTLERMVHFAVELQRACQIADETFYASHQAVVGVLERYNARQKSPHRQRLVWRLSSRTLKVLRPTDRLTSMLPTIQEQGQPGEAARLRSGSESSDDLSEESKDWPTSPLVPVICNDN